MLDTKPKSAEPTPHETPPPKTGWEAWAAVLGVPAASTTAAHFAAHNPVINLTVAGVSALGVVVVGPIGKELKTRYEKRVSTAIDERDRFGLGGFREKYLKHLEFRYRTFDVKGLSTTGPHSLELQRVFVELSMVSQAQHKTSTDPIRDVSQSMLMGRRTIWEYLKSDTGGIHNLAVIGAPGSGKTTLLKHMTLTLTAGREQCEQDGAPFKLPILLFLRDHADKIKANADYTLPQSVKDTLIRFQGPMPPTTDWFDKKLTEGECLIMLDGLDEVADTDTRKKVVEWVEKQIGAHGNNLFVVSSRPGGYKDNPISDVNVVEVLPFSRNQQEQFVNNWYLANEMMSQQKNDEGVRLMAREGANDLLRRIRANIALADLAVNPLLLTMIATVHHYRSSLPGRRVELYGEICEVFLGKRHAAVGLTEDLTPLQKQRVLQPLACEMMKREVPEITSAEAAKIIKSALWMTSGNKIAPEVFLKAVEHGSGLLLERENSVYSFAHLTFQEYLAAVHIQEQSLEKYLTEQVNKTWWHESIRLYCARIADATPIISACLPPNPFTPSTLALAFECKEEAGGVQPEVRAQMDDLLNKQIEADDYESRVAAALTLLTIRLRRMVRVNEDLYIDTSLITHAEYQLFLDEMREQGKFYQPDHWTEYRFPVGQGRTPIRGVRSLDAVAFCEWLNQQKEGEWHYRLPTPKELNNEPLQEPMPMDDFVGYWATESGRAECVFVNISVVEWKSKMITVLATALASDRSQALERILNRTHDVDLGRVSTLASNLNVRGLSVYDNGSALASDLNHILDRSLDRDRVLDRALARANALTLARANISTNTNALELWLILTAIIERRAGNLPAFEGIRIVKERIQAAQADNTIAPGNGQQTSH